MSHTRRLRVGQREDLARHLLRLDPDSRRLRFMGHVSDARLVEYVRLLPALASLQIGWFDDEGAMRGCGELHVRPGALFDHRAELALSVETAWRGRGIGRHLLEHLMVLASNRGIHVLLVQCLEENHAMRHLVRGLGGRYHSNDGKVCAVLFPAWRPQLTLACEWLAEACAALNWWHPRFMAHCGQARGGSRGPGPRPERGGYSEPTRYRPVSPPGPG